MEEKQIVGYYQLIKTVSVNSNRKSFDNEVNSYLKQGWGIVTVKIIKLTNDIGYFAVLAKWEEVGKAEEEPVVENESIKHGRWIDYGRNNDWVKFYRCSVCENEAEDASETEFVLKKYKYCPYCGARMDGDSE